MNPVFACIFENELIRRCYFERTQRSLLLHGFSPSNIWRCSDMESLSIRLRGLENKNQSVFFIESGAWLASPVYGGAFLELPHTSSTGRSICAVGSVRSLVPDLQTEAMAWQELAQITLGDLQSADSLEQQLPLLRSCYLEWPLLTRLRELTTNKLSLQRALRTLATSRDVRLIPWQPLDIYYDTRRRIAQIITSLQRGGAERVAFDLHRNLDRLGFRATLISLGHPSREAFESPKGTIDLSQRARSHAGRMELCQRTLQSLGVDLIHSHLLKNDDLTMLASIGVPNLATIHNTREGWPDALQELGPSDVSLLIACSINVEKELRQAKPCLSTRTVWNGIELLDGVAFPPNEATRLGDLKKGENELVLVAIANPRPQKRLERLPAILALLHRKLFDAGHPRNVKLWIAGQASQRNELAQQSESKLKTAIEASGLADRIQLLGAVSDIRCLLSRSDVLVSAAAHEGLSLAHLEAISANVPVVATDVGGTREIANRSQGLTLLPANASDELFADTLMDIVLAKTQSNQSMIASSIRRDFSSYTMSMSYAKYYERAIAMHHRGAGQGLVLVINNFSTGGAQSSARRLLTGLQARGISVRAVILEEHPDHPTVGRQALMDAGIPVQVLHPAGSIDPWTALQPMLASIDDAPPQTIVFWNAITEYKLLIADSIWGIPMVDVSPGEMYYTSLDRYFQRPRPGLPYINGRDYGSRLDSMVVKYAAEETLARETLGTQVHVVPNGVSLHRAVKLGASENPLLLGTVARVSHQKKLEELIEAIRLATPKMPAFRMQIVGGVERGSEQYADDLRESSRGLPIDWLGEQSDPSETMRTWELFVLISEPMGCPNAGLEAMSHGLPLVATDAGGASEQVRDRVNGRLVPRGDVPGLANAICELAHDADLRIRYGKASHERIATHFNAERMIDDYCRVFRMDVPT